jgi:hypothetical protein
MSCCVLDFVDISTPLRGQAAPHRWRRVVRFARRLGRGCLSHNDRRRRRGQFHLDALVRIERRQVVEVDAVAHLLRIVEVDGVDLEERKIALAFLGRADLALDGVASAQAEATDLAGAHIDVVRPRQVVGLG